MRPPGAILAPGESIIATVFKFVEPPENNEKQMDQKSRVKFKIMSLQLTGRSDETIAVIESYLRTNKMFVNYNEIEKVYSSYLELKLEDVELCISGPKRYFPNIKIGTFCNMKNCLISNIPNVACLNLTTLLRSA
ncbi:hypothetical protein ERO13_D11G227940v2 [Gossypium hirsutum]|uniref:Aconitate hydratase, cytoplasmic isoform X2 n=2 Tax=Gossypium TaxID=3633 RepID=A0ABM3B091_GOSHI|nr:aconitate hydratase, cytoplasmic-like isoform X2 [Gossypium hirsutum]KAG4121830.1 hypothetical protein ERO13_D11G227940v2 [Gossypium hirsutum]KAG4121831.1 hypothetical protein ERO13_D11G227940v2 [Gossypium hirsutum]KAG4121832.1 hypothetical protein ERO13_D11G227940v2 [Gossypium hirsutum]TYG46504.1 hypothetical protein ES288_D11G260800v1 [Gossypium darwinii]